MYSNSQWEEKRWCLVTSSGGWREDSTLVIQKWFCFCFLLGLPKKNAFRHCMLYGHIGAQTSRSWDDCADYVSKCNKKEETEIGNCFVI